MYILNYFQAGSNMKSFSYSSGIGWASFQDKIDFNYIRELGKKMIKRSMQDNNPCLNDLRVYFSIIKIENDSIVGSYTGSFKSLNIIDWKLPKHIKTLKQK